MSKHDLCFAEYAKCLKDVLREFDGSKYLERRRKKGEKKSQNPKKDSDVAVVGMLLDWICCQLPFDSSSTGGAPLLLSREVSNLLNRKTEIPQAIQEFCMRKEAADEAIEHFRSEVIPELNPYRHSDLCQMLWNLVEDDEIIGEKTKKELDQHRRNGEEAEFLGKLLIYVLNRDNKRPEEKSGSDDSRLLREVNYQCPCCLTQLTSETEKNYRIVKIYPDKFPDPKVEKEFENVTKPKKPNGFENKIALCREHANSYLEMPTLDMYNDLKGKKDDAVKVYQSEVSLDGFPLYDKIKDVIEALCRSESEETTRSNESEETTENLLSMIPLSIGQKISSKHLKDDVTGKVLLHYNNIKDIFDGLDRNRTNTFNRIARDIRSAYKALSKAPLSQNEIVDKLAEWIMKKAKIEPENLLECRFVVAFFIQNCEVFDAISK